MSIDVTHPGSIQTAGRPSRGAFGRSGRSSFVCSGCGASQPKWVGCCPGCGEWNTLQEALVVASAVVHSGEAVPLTQVPSTSFQAVPTGISELDRALGGGLVPGSVTLVCGEPGIGKSTLTLQLAAEQVCCGRSVLMVCAEESPAQVRGRAERLGGLYDDLLITSVSSVEGIVGLLDRHRPDLLIVDSIQTVHLESAAGGGPGSTGQVRACAQRLVVEAKERGLTTVLVGHLTKDGSLAGPKVLEHVVDTVTELAGDRHHALRLLRVSKHRFGPTDELGLFEMASAGLLPVDDPSGLFLADRSVGTSGSVVLPAMEGHRTLLVELQALVARSTTPHPRRSSQGVDPRRLALLLAVLERRVCLDLSGVDVYATAVGGVQVTEPGSDLPLALAVVSAATNRCMAAQVVACGEVGLGGEVRQVAGLERRLHEAHRLGFHRAILPASSPEPPAGMTAVWVATLADAVAAAGLSTGPAVAGGAAYQTRL
ncbi:MAG: DNA repair protein RadA [Actinobacteria bacterium]|nr:DNA repair protein RadA [Actinomycetota bacterium]MDP6176493.1 DNA repair protein RadA [Acidimicrobiales bacterium]HJO99162.1 DNA repair protein RadA [Acidimicrobiales bacterium]